jgi:hypothetical protein
MKLVTKGRVNDGLLQRDRSGRRGMGENVNGEQKSGQYDRTEDPVTTLTSTEIGFQAVCTCGWKGSERDRMSDDYAWTNVRDDMISHERTHKKRAPHNQTGSK